MEVFEAFEEVGIPFAVAAGLELNRNDYLARCRFKEISNTKVYKSPMLMKYLILM